ncbi:MAG: Coenzyme F420 hydrogenase/dehydrogenase, beta subunit C-terminal domain, partial [Planctomycetota bacterium]
MATIKVKDNDPVAAIRELLRTMLSKQLVSAILVPQEIPSKKTVVQTLVRDPDKLDAVNPLAPIFGINSARIVAKMCIDQMTGSVPGQAVFEQPEQEQEAEPPETEDSASEQKEEQTPEQDQGKSEEQAPAEAESTIEDEPAATEGQSAPAPIAVVLRPCEIRALVELVKLQQASLEPFLVIGVDCWGTYLVQEYAAKVTQGPQDSSVTVDFLKQVTAGNFPEELRGACRACQYPVPTYADLAFQLIGDDINQQIRLEAQSEKGKEIFNALGFEVTEESKERKSAVEKLKEAKKQLAEQDQADFLEVISSLCINCHNCRAVCPICYCKQCVFDGNVFEYPLEKYLNWSGKKGVLPVPPDKL